MPQTCPIRKVNGSDAPEGVCTCRPPVREGRGEGGHTCPGGEFEVVRRRERESKRGKEGRGNFVPYFRLLSSSFLFPRVLCIGGKSLLVFLFICVCVLSVSVSVCISVSIFLPILTKRIFVCILIFLSTSPSIFVSLHLYQYFYLYVPVDLNSLHIYIPIFLYSDPSIFVSLHISTSLYICPSVSVWFMSCKVSPLQTLGLIRQLLYTHLPF